MWSVSPGSAGRTARPTAVGSSSSTQSTGPQSHKSAALAGNLKRQPPPSSLKFTSAPTAAKGAGWAPSSPNATLLTTTRSQGNAKFAEGSRPLKDESSEVVVVLRELGLSQYADTLLTNGFDDMDTLLHSSDMDMKEMGMTPSHVLKLRRGLQEMHPQGPCPQHLDGNNPVVVFLKEINLSQYAESLLQSGFDELEALQEIEDNDMKDLGIPRGHAVKLRRRLREYCSSGGVSSESCSAWGAAAVLPPDHGLPNGQMQNAVERSWERVQALGTYSVGELFYRHTFVIAPEVMDLFPPEVRFKYRDWTADEGADESNVYESPALRKLFSKFLNAIGCTVAGLHDFGRLVPMLTQLGARHCSYGLREEHWPILGKALALTLKDCLGREFTAEVEAAWSMVYGFMSNIMIEGLRARSASKISAEERSDVAAKEDDCCSEGSSLTTGLPSEADCGNRHASALEQCEQEDGTVETDVEGQLQIG